MGSLPETHGRWPLVGAAALAPVTVAALSNPSLRPLAALLAHQTEEWVRPGGFLPWINREVLGGDDDEFPIDRRAGFVINVGFGWLLSASVLAGSRAAAPQAMLYASHIGNAGLHIGWAVKHRRYDPGLASGALALLPVGLSGLRRLFKDPAADPVQTGVGLVAGVIFAVGMAPFFKRRLKRST
jgi:hypothetical protein